jgi:2-C-methyl-D-erythritol 4-phosphate cytidylyltransferase/2-C-methyl-D-erythritol 2,4-cyclodiphosphate synthase
MNLCAVILAAGSSSRFDDKIPKQYHYYKNDILINHSLKKLNEIKEIKKIFVTINTKIYKKYKSFIFKSPKFAFIEGGKERQDSVLNSLKIIKKKFSHVLIHDAARPDFSYKIIKNIINNLKKNDCVVPGIKSTDTAIIDNKLKDRKKVLLLQTPQGFKLNELKKLHFKNSKKITDDSSLFYLSNLKVKIINGSYKNKKITYKDDLYSQNKIYGIGYDIHRMVEKRKLIIGGIHIPYPLGPIGHSDGDSLLHALIDSFLGAAKLGDIGTLFPNSNKYKNISSSKLLINVIDRLKRIGLKVSSIDLNIILQKPNLKNYKNKIKKNISKLCKIDQSKINIKAKTTDKLGIIGKNKALACEVISTLSNV